MAVSENLAVKDCYQNVFDSVENSEYTVKPVEGPPRQFLLSATVPTCTGVNELEIHVLTSLKREWSSYGFFENKIFSSFIHAFNWALYKRFQN